jgi:putative nucleotidyltransferase with HDIG domain
MFRFARFRPPRRTGAALGEIPALGGGRGRRVRQWAWWLVPPILLLLVHQALFPPAGGFARVRYELGQVAQEEIRAPFEFSAPRPISDIERDRRDAAQRVEPVFVRNNAAERRTLRALDEFRTFVRGVANDGSSTLAQKVATLQNEYPGLEAGTIRAVLVPEDLEAIFGALLPAIDQHLSEGIVDVLPRGTYQKVCVLAAAPGDEATGVEALECEIRPEAVEMHRGHRLGTELEEFLRDELPRSGLRFAAADIGRYSALPNLIFDEPTTARLRTEAEATIPTVRTYAPNERIVDEAVPITRDDLAVLEALQEERFKERLRRDRSARQRMRLGRVLMLGVLLGGFVQLLRQSDPALVWNPNRYVLLFVLWALFLGLAAVALQQSVWGGSAAVPAALLAMLAVVLYGEELAYRILAAGLLMVWMVPEQTTPMVLVWTSAGVSSVWMLRRVRNRNQFYRALGVVSLAAAASAVAVELGAGGFTSEALANAGRAAGSVAVSTALTLFLLPLFEAVFGVTTELTLLELSDLNHPLVRRMSLESPGTFHHSQVVGMLGEAASQAIGANSLLIRVGANFHDIGKMLKPRYFAENQGGPNPHDELTPRMSALVIASHVKDGIELGREWGLPESVLAFIPEHHGTSVMQYFYRKALESETDGRVLVDDFRYPGPRPRSKETAILMLADGCEASVRSLRRPTMSRVREMVRKIFDGKSAEGELDECGLTMQELAKIREAFIPILVGIHHQRVSYPGQKEHEARKEQESREARARARRSGSAVVSGS